MKHPIFYLLDFETARESESYSSLHHGTTAGAEATTSRIPYLSADLHSHLRLTRRKRVARETTTPSHLPKGPVEIMLQKQLFHQPTC